MQLKEKYIALIRVNQIHIETTQTKTKTKTKHWKLDRQNNIKTKNVCKQANIKKSGLKNTMFALALPKHTQIERIAKHKILIKHPKNLPQNKIETIHIPTILENKNKKQKHKKK